MLRTKTNEELFSLYKAELELRIRNQRNLERYHQVLDQFQEFLEENPPSPMLAKSFLSKWSRRKPATLSKYLSIIKGFLNWHGEDIDLKVNLPRQLPEYVEEESIKKLIEAVKSKQTHKRSIAKDILLIELAYNSGLRREELSNLKVRDILVNEKALIVRKGKGIKDRTVPLPSDTMELLQSHITYMNPDDSVFNLKSTAISDKIRRIAKNAGVKIHTHSLRHGYATRLLEKGANIKAVQELLGHSRIGTTEAYLGLLPKHLRETVDLLDTHSVQQEQKVSINTIDSIIAGKTTERNIQPLLTIKDINKKQYGEEREYYMHFVIKNEGHSPAIGVELFLLDDELRLLECYRETVLGSQAELIFKPTLNRSKGKYYVLCQYKQASNINNDEIWNQTWLPFNLSRASREGEVYVSPGELEFKFYIPVEDRVKAFRHKPK